MTTTMLTTTQWSQLLPANSPTSTSSPWNRRPARTKRLLSLRPPSMEPAPTPTRGSWKRRLGVRAGGGRRAPAAAEPATAVTTTSSASGSDTFGAREAIFVLPPAPAPETHEGDARRRASSPWRAARARGRGAPDRRRRAELVGRRELRIRHGAARGRVAPVAGFLSCTLQTPRQRLYYDLSVCGTHPLAVCRRLS